MPNTKDRRPAATLSAEPVALYTPMGVVACKDTGVQAYFGQGPASCTQQPACCCGRCGLRITGAPSRDKL